MILHIGYPKSASTTLQKQLFDRHSELNFLGVYPTKNIGIDSEYVNENSHYLRSAELRDFHHIICNIDGVDYRKFSIDKVKKSLEPYLSEQKVNVISNERLASVLFSHPDRESKAYRIRGVIGNAKVLIILRNQYDIIKSQYRDHPFDPRHLTANRKYVSLNQWVEIDRELEVFSFTKSIKYSNLIKLYQDLFGVKAVKVMLFEDLVYDLNKFCKELSDFLEISEVETKKLLSEKHENKSVSNDYNKYRTFRECVGKYVPTILKRNRNIVLLDGFIKNILLKSNITRKPNYSEDILHWIDSYYREDNNLLSEEFCLNMRKYNYPMEDA